ncbi:MAG: YHS domain-containing protein [bacterium]
MKHQKVDRDPVCGKRINRNKAHITIEYKGQNYFLCCPLCQAEFEKRPGKYVNKGMNRSRLSPRRSAS